MTCTWEPDPACLADSWNALEPEVKERSLMLATSSLQMLTNNRVGTCPITIRPCVSPNTYNCGHGAGTTFFPHVGADGNWYNACGCLRPCKPLSEVDLPGPVGYVDAITVDGEPLPLDTGDWRLDDGHLLVWQGAGLSPIPETQDLNKPDTEVGTWSITYSRSYPVNADAKIAVAYLAMEFAKACTGKGKCSLPRGVSSVVRNGVTFSIEAGLFPNGLTQIDIVDQFILKWAPAGSPTQTAQVFDPRKSPPRRINSLPVRSV